MTSFSSKQDSSILSPLPVLAPPSLFTLLKLYLECLQVKANFATDLPGKLNIYLKQRSAKLISIHLIVLGKIFEIAADRGILNHAIQHT